MMDKQIDEGEEEREEGQRRRRKDIRKGEKEVESGKKGRQTCAFVQVSSLCYRWVDDRYDRSN